MIMVGVPSTAKDAKQLVDFIGRCVSWRHGIIETCGLIHGISILDPVFSQFFLLGGSSKHPLASPWKHGMISEVYGKLRGFILQDLKNSIQVIPAYRRQSIMLVIVTDDCVLFDCIRLSCHLWSSLSSIFPKCFKTTNVFSF